MLQREEALLNDLEVTGQAFEDMQEQNLRLLQQLREKDDANFKLMSEVRVIMDVFPVYVRVCLCVCVCVQTDVSNQIQKLLNEERDTLDCQDTQMHCDSDQGDDCLVQRIKSNQIQKLLKEEKDVLDEQGTQLQQQVEAQNLVVRSLEDKERIMQNSLAIIEKESR